MSEEFNLNKKRRVFLNECLEQATTNDERCLVNTIFMFIAKQDKEFISRLKEFMDECIRNEDSQIVDKTYKHIDKLAGDDLK